MCVLFGLTFLFGTIVAEALGISTARTWFNHDSPLAITHASSTSPPTPGRNLNYWDSVSTLAGEVENPGKTFPRALAGAVAVVVAGYLFPLVVGLSYSAKAKDWDLGYFAVVGDQVLGWLSQGVGWVEYQVEEYWQECSC